MGQLIEHNTASYFFRQTTVLSASSTIKEFQCVEVRVAPKFSFTAFSVAVTFSTDWKFRFFLQGEYNNPWITLKNKIFNLKRDKGNLFLISTSITSCSSREMSRKSLDFWRVTFTRVWEEWNVQLWTLQLQLLQLDSSSSLQHSSFWEASSAPFFLRTLKNICFTLHFNVLEYKSFRRFFPVCKSS